MMRTLAIIWILVFAGTNTAHAQHNPELKKLNGYWVQSEDRGFSYSSVLIFDETGDGRLTGRAYFISAADDTQEFDIDEIQLDGDSLSFSINDTPINFFGVLNVTGKFCEGIFLMEGNNSIQVRHRHMNAAEFRAYSKRRQPQERIIKREIDADDGLIISQLNVATYPVIF